MKIKALAMTGCLAAAMAVPGLAKTTESMNTLQTLQNFRRVADDAASKSDRLKLLAQAGETDYIVNGEYLEAVRDDVNRMGAMLRTLEAERDSATPAERAAIDKAAEWLPSMAANTTAALDYLNKYEANFWAPGFVNPVSALAEEASHVYTSINDAVRLQHLQAKARNLRRGIREGA
jgi:hypothetical protein